LILIVDSDQCKAQSSERYR